MGPIEDEDARPQRQRPKLADVVGYAQRLDRKIGVAHNLGVNREEEIFATHLQGVTCEIDHGDGIRSGSRRLFDEIAQCVAQRVAVKIARADDVEASSLQRLRDQARIICGC